IGVAAGLAAVMAIGGVLELATPYGFWFRRSIFGLGNASPGSPAAKLIAQVNDDLQKDTYASLQDSMKQADPALRTSPNAPYLQALFAEVVFRVQQRCGGPEGQVARAKAMIAPLERVDAKDLRVVRAMGALQLLEGKPEMRTALAQAGAKNPKDPEPLYL